MCEIVLRDEFDFRSYERLEGTTVEEPARQLGFGENEAALDSETANKWGEAMDAVHAQKEETGRNSCTVGKDLHDDNMKESLPLALCVPRPPSGPPPAHLLDDKNRGHMAE